jgi:gas vesicle protein
MAQEKVGYWRGVVTGLLFGAAASLFLTPDQSSKAKAKISAGAAALQGRTDDSAPDDSETTPDTAEVAEKVEEEAHDVVDSV